MQKKYIEPSPRLGKSKLQPIQCKQICNYRIGFRSFENGNWFYAAWWLERGWKSKCRIFLIMERCDRKISFVFTHMRTATKPKKTKKNLWGN